MTINRTELLNTMLTFDYNSLDNIKVAKDLVAILNVSAWAQQQSENPTLPASSIERLQKLFNKVQIELMYAEEIINAGKEHPEFDPAKRIKP